MRLTTKTISCIALTLISILCLNAMTIAAESRWEPWIQKFEKQDKENPPKKGDIMFLGSSSIVGWDLKKSFPDMELVNRGFGGSQISDSIEFFDRIIMPHRPRLIVSYMGGNDIAAGESVESVVGDFKKFVGMLHAQLPETRFVYLSVKLCNRRWKNRDKINEVNRQISEICKKDPLLDFIDIGTVTLDKDGKPISELYRKDQLHFNPKGYVRLSKLVRPYLEAAGAGK